MVIGLPIIIEPFGPVVPFSPFPLVVFGPTLGIIFPRFITGQEVSLHVAGMICRVVPERGGFRLMVLLPGVVDLLNGFPHLLSLFLRWCRRSSPKATSYSGHCRQQCDNPLVFHLSIWFG